jgi:hypothetical protein
MTQEVTKLTYFGILGYYGNITPELVRITIKKFPDATHIDTGYDIVLISELDIEATVAKYTENMEANY